MKFKDYIAKQLYGKRLHFHCECIMNIDVEGRIIGHEMSGEEIIFLIDVDGKIIKIGENHPNMFIS